MRIDIISVLPKMFEGIFSCGVVGRAIERGVITLKVHDLHNYSYDKHRTVDDRPYGGGSGMVLKVEPIYKAIKSLSKKNSYVIYMSAQGKVLTQKNVISLSKKKHLIVLCGRYEGVDERVMSWIDEEISIGDYILTGGEIPAMVLVDSVCRGIKGVVKEEESLKNESFLKKFLDYPQYTRPYSFRGKKVPSVLLSGNHKEIERFRLFESIRNTYIKRPDLLKDIKLTKIEKEILSKIKLEN